MRVTDTMRRIWNAKILTMLLFVLAILATHGIFLQTVSAEEPDDLFTGDNNLHIYPYNQDSLRKARVILGTDSLGNIEKIYHYNRTGQLDIIHLPLKKISLFIEKKNKNYQYILARGSKIYLIQGGNFDNFNIEYAGTGGIADTLIAEKYLKSIIKSTRRSIEHVDAAILRYEKRTGKTLSEEEFNRPVTTSHLLMSIPGMNTAYFFDGHGQRLQLHRTAYGSTITSVTIQADLGRLRTLQKSLTGFKNMQKLVTGIVIALLAILVVLGFIFFNVITKAFERIIKSLDFTHQTK